MKNQEIYKRVKINWWIIILLGGFYVWMIFAYIHKWGNSPVDESGLIFLGIIWIAVFIFLGRFKVIIDNNHTVFRSDIWVPVKIPLTAINKITVIRVGMMINVSGKNEKYYFDFVNQAVRIQLKNGKIYQIAIKDAEKVKEEIEKRMLTTNISS